MNKEMPTIGVIGGISEPSPTSAFQNFKRQGCVDTYINAFDKLSVNIVIIPHLLKYNENNIISYISKLDGLLITGGQDVDPKVYNEEKKEYCKTTDLQHDLFALSLIKEAVKQKKSILGICRGCQLLNVAFEGSLYQDQKHDDRDDKSTNHFDLNNIDTYSHEIIINKDSKLYKIFEKQSLKVNSLHHQSVKQVGNKLKLSALSIDGVVEGIEYYDESFFCLGVQWHPETLITKSDDMLPLFKSFVDSTIKP